MTNNFYKLILFCAMQHKEIVMSHNYFQQRDLNPLMNSLERPVKELMELNVKTLQSFSYLTPVELLKVRKPEEVMEKNIEVLIGNSHKALDYMQNMFDIMEKHWLGISDSVIKNTKEMVSQGQKNTQAVATKAKTAVKRAASTTSSLLKEKSKKNVKQAQSSARKVAVKSTAVKAKPKAKPKARIVAKSTASPMSSHVKSASSAPKDSSKNLSNKREGSTHDTQKLGFSSVNPVMGSSLNKDRL